MSFSEEKLWDHINDGWSHMSFGQRKLWEMIKRFPEEWEVTGYGRCWVVALMGNRVIFYDHFEEGFSQSSWSRYGAINQYQSGDDLGHTVQMLLNNIVD